MRPIDRGFVPLKKDGKPVTVKDYKAWRKHLIERIGAYCCFCNIRLTDSPQVEHVIAQKIDPTKALDWDNMLLACGPCNRTKSDKPCPPNTHYLPQFHNTHLAFSYKLASVSHPERKNEAYVGLKATKGLRKNKSKNTISLCALDRDTTSELPKATDLRWKFRGQAIITAALARKSYIQKPEYWVLFKTLVLASDCWSVWFNTFADMPEARKILVESFPGTARNCFDTNYMPIPRNPTNTQDPL